MKHPIRRLAAAAFATSALAATYVIVGRIAPLLPAEGARRCFQGDFDGATGLSFGFPHMNQPGQAHVTRLVLRLDREAGQEPHLGDTSIYTYDWRYDFRVAVETSNHGRFTAGGQCDWTNGVVARLTPGLGCFIDCDGGGFKLARARARSAVDMDWPADSWLRMSSCGGGGEILRGGATTKTFRLEAAPDDVCKDRPPIDD